MVSKGCWVRWQQDNVLKSLALFSVRSESLRDHAYDPTWPRHQLRSYSTSSWLAQTFEDGGCCSEVSARPNRAVAEGDLLVWRHL